MSDLGWSQYAQPVLRDGALILLPYSTLLNALGAAVVPI